MKYQMLKLKRCKKPEDSELMKKVLSFVLNHYTFIFISSGFDYYFYCIQNEKWYTLENEVRK